MGKPAVSVSHRLETKYGALLVGDVAIVQGHRFLVAAIYLRADRRIEFTGRALDESLIGTGYDGATYGGYMDRPITVEIRSRVRITPALGRKISAAVDEFDSPEAFNGALARVQIRHLGRAYRLAPCTGEAHRNAWIDNCTDCAPLWGFVAVEVSR